LCVRCVWEYVHAAWCTGTPHHNAMGPTRLTAQPAAAERSPDHWASTTGQYSCVHSDQQVISYWLTTRIMIFSTYARTYLPAPPTPQRATAPAYNITHHTTPPLPVRHAMHLHCAPYRDRPAHIPVYTTMGGDLPAQPARATPTARGPSCHTRRRCVSARTAGA
jgi:hypothetical protein